MCRCWSLFVTSLPGALLLLLLVSPVTSVFKKVEKAEKRQCLIEYARNQHVEDEGTWISLGSEGKGTTTGAENWIPPLDYLNGTMSSGDPATMDPQHAEQASRLHFHSPPLPHHSPATHTPFHWAILACDRRKWSRFLSNTLLSGFANNMHPATITIVWCKRYNASAMPSLFTNMAFSRKVRVLYLPDGMQQGAKTISGYLRALSVPAYLDQPHLPLLVTEDDVLVAPDFNLRLSHTLCRIHDYLGPGPRRHNYLVNLYSGSAPGSERETLKQMDSLPGVRAAPAGGPEAIELTTGGSAFMWGTQGIFFSPAMTRRMAQHFADVYYKRRDVPGFMDMVIRDFLYERFGKETPGVQITPGMKLDLQEDNMARCLAFKVSPSLVQHVGAISSLFGNVSMGNNRYHMAMDYPVKVAIPSTDPDEYW